MLLVSVCCVYGDFQDCPAIDGQPVTCEDGAQCCCEDIDDVTYCATTPDGYSWLCANTGTWSCCGCNSAYCVECNADDGWKCSGDGSEESPYLCISSAFSSGVSVVVVVTMMLVSLFVM